MHITNEDAFHYKTVVRTYADMLPIRQGCAQQDKHHMYIDLHDDYTKLLRKTTCKLYAIFMERGAIDALLGNLGASDYVMNGDLYEKKTDKIIYSFGGLMCEISPCPTNHKRDEITLLLTTNNDLVDTLGS